MKLHDSSKLVEAYKNIKQIIQIHCRNKKSLLDILGEHYLRYRRGNQKWTIQGNWQHRVYKDNPEKLAT
jgi:hypothetical protein